MGPRKQTANKENCPSQSSSEKSSSTSNKQSKSKSNHTPLRDVSVNCGDKANVTIQVNEQPRHRKRGREEDPASDQEEFDGQRPLNHRKAIHANGQSLAPKPNKALCVDQKFVISELPEKEQELWLGLQESFSLHFFTSKDIMTCCELDELVVTLYQKQMNASEEPTKQQIRAVRQRLENFFTLIKQKVLNHVLQDYGLNKVQDGPQRGQAVEGLTIDLENKFLYPDATVRRQRYFHPAIVNTIQRCFFFNNGLASKTLPSGGTMRDEIPEATIAWVCATIHWALTNVTNHGELNLSAKGFGVTNSRMQESVAMFLENIKPKTPRLLAKAVYESCVASKRQAVTAPKKFLPDDDDDDDSDDDGDVVCLGNVDCINEKKKQKDDEKEEDDDE